MCMIKKISVVCLSLLLLTASVFADDDVPSISAGGGDMGSSAMSSGGGMSGGGGSSSGNMSSGNSGVASTVPGVGGPFGAGQSMAGTLSQGQMSQLGQSANQLNNTLQSAQPGQSKSGANQANNATNFNFAKQTNNMQMNTNGFQQQVFVRTGLTLQNYGYNFFTNPNAFTATSNELPSSNYILGPGDQISIRGWGAVDINLQEEIDPEGGIVIPKVGRVSLVGVRVSNLEKYLKAKLGRSYRNFSISATVTRLRSIQILVAGLAANPGTYTVNSLSTLNDAIFASGGPSMAGSLRDIELKRDGVVIAHYDMYDLLLNGNNTGDIRLAPGDVIYIPPHGNEVAIYDGVKVPAIYEAKPGETVADILRFAGGVTGKNTQNKLIVEKMDAKKQIHVFGFAYADGLQQIVEDGEIIHFFTAANKYINSVMLIGNVVNPTRLAWYKGMRVKDAIPSKDALLTKSFWNSYNYNTYAKDNQAGMMEREKTANLASSMNNVQYSGGLNSTQSGSPEGSQSSTQGAQQMGQSNSPFNVGDNLFVAGPVAIPEADINWHYAVIVRLDHDKFQSKLIPFDLSLALQGDAKNNLLLESGDVINVLSSKDILSPSRKGSLYVLIDGEVNHPGVFELKPGSRLLDAIKTAQGITSDAYLYGLVLSRQTVKVQQRASLNVMLDNAQQALLAQSANSVAQTAVNGAGATTGMVVSQQQALIDKLRQLQPTGRVILGLNASHCESVSDLPNIALENGDVIHVPATPSTISVVGQVYNPATFMYSTHRSIGDYIDMAGTTNDFADDSSVYVVHADGTVYNKQQAGWFGSFAMRDVHPGDAIIVPQNVQFITAQQNLLNWTQILSNFGMGAAALAVFKSN